jgi:hypothetical protein
VQSNLMAQVVANPRIDPVVLDRDEADLLVDATEQSYAEFERRIRTWESLADAAGDRERAERNHANRDAMIRPRPDGGWDLTASLDGVSGSEFTQIFAHFIEAEWRADWAEAHERLGDGANTNDLRRTEPQRRADALVAMARSAAVAPAGASRPMPTVNILIDEASFASIVAGESIDPVRYRDVVCRTQSGHRLHTGDAVRTALWGWICRAVYDSDGVIIDLGRRSRLFRGSARKAVMLRALECDFPACDMPAEWCDVDHSISWAAHGATVPRNGVPFCHRHNVDKENGFTVVRDDDGDWHYYDPAGNEIT